MIHQVLAIRDSAVNAYDRPFYTPTNAAGIRAFADNVRNKESPMSQHPEDFTLWFLGTYDDETGQFLQTQPPMQIARAQDYKE